MKQLYTYMFANKKNIYNRFQFAISASLFLEFKKLLHESIQGRA